MRSPARDPNPGVVLAGQRLLPGEIRQVKDALRAWRLARVMWIGNRGFQSGDCVLGSAEQIERVIIPTFSRARTYTTTNACATVPAYRVGVHPGAAYESYGSATSAPAERRVFSVEDISRTRGFYHARR